MPQEIDVRKTTTAAAEAVWTLLDDSSSWPSWSPIDSFELERPPQADGLGEIRLFHSGRRTMREEIVERRSAQRLSYTLLGGLAVRDYRAEIDLTSSAAGTEIRWHTTFDAKVPGMGWLYRGALEKVTKEFIDGLAAKAEGRG